MNTRGRESSSPVAFLFIAAFGFLVAGCGAVAHNANFVPEFSPGDSSRVRLGDIRDVAPKEKRGDQADFDIAGELRAQLTNKLEKRGLLASERADGGHYVLSAEIVDYEPGSAFGRWLFPGVGSTILSVECRLFDGKKMIGAVSAHRTVEAGGAYTIGAWKTIFASVADDIVGELEEKLKPGV